MAKRFLIEYEVNFTPIGQKYYNELPHSIKIECKKILAKLHIKPIGKQLKGSLTGFHSLHFANNKWRVIYAIKTDLQIVLIGGIVPRTNQTYEIDRDLFKKKYGFIFLFIF